MTYGDLEESYIKNREEQLKNTQINLKNYGF